jgi:putative transposase
VLLAALGIDGEGHKHPLALIEGATENAAVAQALIDNLIERGLDPKICRLFIIDGELASHCTDSSRPAFGSWSSPGRL